MMGRWTSQRYAAAEPGRLMEDKPFTLVHVRM
jgi:hypothetical protein